jgi:hypothetical protein
VGKEEKHIDTRYKCEITYYVTEQKLPEQAFGDGFFF